MEILSFYKVGHSQRLIYIEAYRFTTRTRDPVRNSGISEGPEALDSPQKAVEAVRKVQKSALSPSLFGRIAKIDARRDMRRPNRSLCVLQYGKIAHSHFHGGC